MNEKQKNQETFVIRILGTEHATWQGSVTHLDNNQTVYFRSELELIKIIDGTLEKEQAAAEESIK
ncbi:MAG: hypothetical protein HFE76_06630 [Firmicutes bacterium]|nr:hypothetical protein [Bacillota bacterium]